MHDDIEDDAEDTIGESKSPIISEPMPQPDEDDVLVGAGGAHGVGAHPNPMLTDGIGNDIEQLDEERLLPQHPPSIF